MKKLSLFLLACALTACGELSVQNTVVTPTPDPSATPFATATGLAAHAVPTLPVTPSPAVLPAPVYFISAANKQLWRLERDGSTLTQITHEIADVLSFSVSPVDGALAYVSGNALIRTDAQGAQRQVLVQGPVVDMNNPADYLNAQVGQPLWSPDGQSIVYGLGGVNRIAATGAATPETLLQSSPYPDPTRDIPQDTAFYAPISYAPNGQWVLITKAYFGDSCELQLLPVDGSAPIPLTGPESFCGLTTWASDSAHLYLANDQLGMFSTGLWQVTLPASDFQTVVRGYTGDNTQPLSADQTFSFVNYPFEVNGQLYALAATRPASDEVFQTRTPLTLARITATGQIEPVRSDAYLVGGALGAPDGSGILIVDIAESLTPELGYTNSGHLRWLPSADQPALTLPAEGYALAWGK